MVSVPRETRVTARTLVSPRKIGFAYVPAFSGWKHHAKYTKFLYTRLSPTILRKIQGQELRMLINGESEICMMSDQVARELNIRLKHGD